MIQIQTKQTQAMREILILAKTRTRMTIQERLKSLQMKISHWLKKLLQRQPKATGRWLGRISLWLKKNH